MKILRVGSAQRAKNLIIYKAKNIGRAFKKALGGVEADTFVRTGSKAEKSGSLIQFPKAGSNDINILEKLPDGRMRQRIISKDDAPNGIKARSFMDLIDNGDGTYELRLKKERKYPSGLKEESLTTRYRFGLHKREE